MEARSQYSDGGREEDGSDIYEQQGRRIRENGETQIALALPIVVLLR